jgi:hypothetical protein
MLDHNPVFDSYLGQNEHQLSFNGDGNEPDFAFEADDGGLFSAPKLDLTELIDFHKHEGLDLLGSEYSFVDNLHETPREILGDYPQDIIGEKQADVDDLLSIPNQPIPPFLKDALTAALAELKPDVAEGLFQTPPGKIVEYIQDTMGEKQADVDDLLPIPKGASHFGR